MKHIKNYHYISTFLLSLITFGCANIVPITGGPKDDKEPKLLKSIPNIGTVNFKGGTILFQFDEEIEVDNNPSNIITSPLIDGKIKLKVKNKKYLEVNLSSNLNENTTYSININNAVKDITEGNTYKNLSYAFSTGSKLDSMSISGKTIDAENKTIEKNILIGLYKKSDTIDITKQKPHYITYSTSTGDFQLNYIKSDDYYLLALEDKNKNLLYNSAEKASSIENVSFKKNNTLMIELSTNDTTGNKIISRKMNKNIQTLSFRNGIKSYSYQTLSTSKNLYITQTKNKANELTAYAKLNSNDSLQYSITTQDSLGNTKTDTITINSANKKIKPEPGKLRNETTDLLPGNNTIVFKSSKPIASLNEDSILVNNEIKNSTFRLSKNHDSLSIIITNPITDTTNIKFNKASIIFYDNDSILPQSFTIAKAELSNYSTLEMTIKTNHKNYLIQLLTEDYTIIDEYKNITKLNYNYIKPGKYKIRAIVDENNNSYWDTEKVLKHTKSEPIYYFGKDAINLKPNWELKDLMFIF